MLPLFHQRRYLIPFRSMLLPHILTDTLVIGSGVAGMRAAIAAAGHGDVIVLAKGPRDRSATAWAQGGIAAAVGPGDGIEQHVSDTIDVGAGLCDEAVVESIIGDAPRAVEELIEWGMRFDRDDSGGLDLGREGGHSNHRVLHTDGAATGRELVRCLASRMTSFENVRFFDACFALDLLTNEPNSRANASSGNGHRHPPRVLGAITHHPQYGLQIIWAKATILACGGAGQVFRETTNPKVVTGDGLAMAWRAGAAVADVEFMQFHPTTLYVAGATRELISEAVRGEGVYLVDRAGRRFMPGYHENAELAPRDVVSRAIMDVLARTGETCVYLDARHVNDFSSRFPSLTARLAEFDLDPATDLIPVHPSAHYMIGGVRTDLDGRADLPGLFSCGEASCTGLHGANRLASNSLLEGLVMGRRAGAAAEEMREESAGPLAINSDLHIEEHGELDLTDVASSLRSAMWRNVGIERDGRKLHDVIDMFDFWARYTLDTIFDDPGGWETQNLLTAGALMTRAAAWREETRGVHCRADFPQASDDFRIRAHWKRGEEEPRSPQRSPSEEREMV